MDSFRTDIDQSIILESDGYEELQLGGSLQAVRFFQDANFPFVLQIVRMNELSLGRIPWHWHDEMEVIYAISYPILVRTDRSAHTLYPGDACFINADVLHSVIVQDPDCYFLHFRFHQHLIFPKPNARVASLYSQTITHEPALDSLFFDHTLAAHKNIIAAIKNLIHTYVHKDLCYEMKISGTLQYFWAYLYECAQSILLVAKTKETNADSQRIKEAISFISQNYASPLTLKDIADAIHVSRNECCRCFQRAVGYSPIEYLMHFRILESTKKLKNKDVDAQSISMLAESCGFNNTSYFNKLFKRYTSMTPLQYKKRFCK